MDKSERLRQSTRNNVDLGDPLFSEIETDYFRWCPPVMTTASTSHTGHGHFPSANSNLYGAQKESTSGLKQSDHPPQQPFPASLGGDNNLKLREQTSDVVTYLLEQTKLQFESTKAAIKAEIIAGLTTEIRLVVKQAVEDLSMRLQIQLDRQAHAIVSRQLNETVNTVMREYLQRNPYVLTPLQFDTRIQQ